MKSATLARIVLRIILLCNVLAFCTLDVCAQAGLEPGMTVKANKNIKFLCEGDTVLAINNFEDTAGIYSHFIFNFNAQSNSSYHDVRDTVYDWSSRYHVYQFHDSVVHNNCNEDSIVMEVSLTGYDTSGLDYKITTTVTIFLQPRARISIPSQVCVGDEVDLSNYSCPSVGKGHSYTWDINGTKYKGFEPDSVIMTKAGTYTVKMLYTIQSHCIGSDSTERQITIIDRPVPSSNISVGGVVTSRDTFCTGDTLLFINTSKHTTHHTFALMPSNLGQLINGSKTNSDTLFYEINKPGTLTYSIEAHNAVCSEEDSTRNIVFIENPIVYIKNLPACITDSFINLDDYVDTSSGVPTKTTWRVRGNNLDTTIYKLRPGVIRNLNYGRYTLTVLSEGGCKAVTDSASIFVAPKTTLTPTDTFCFGEDTLVNLNSYIVQYPNGFGPNWFGNVTNDSFFNVGKASVKNHKFTLRDEYSSCYAEVLSIEIVGAAIPKIQDITLCGKANFVIPLDSILPSNYYGNHVQEDTFKSEQAGFGQHIVLYETVNDGCQFVDSFTISIQGASANGILVSSPNCVNTTIKFRQNGNGGISQWTFGDGNGSTATHPSHSYSSSGVYQVVLISDDVCTDTFETQIEIVSPPLSRFVVTIDSSACDSVRIEARFIGLDTSESNQIGLNGTFYDTAQITFIMSRALYDVQAVLTGKSGNLCGAKDSSINVRIPRIHRAQIGIIGLNPGCSGDTLKLVDQSVGAIDSSRTFYGDGTSTKNSVINKPFFNDTDTVKLFNVVHYVYSRSCGLLKDSVQYSLLPNFVKAAAEQNKMLVCPNEPVIFKNNSTLGTTFTLYFGDGGSASGSIDGQRVTHRYVSPSVYLPYIVAQNHCGSDTAYLDSIRVKDLPNLSLTSSNVRGCLGSRFEISYQPDSLTNPHWRVNGQLRDSFVTPFVFQPSMAGVYQIHLEVTGQNCPISDSIEIRVQDADTINFDVMTHVVCDTVFVLLGLSGPGVDYSIDYGDGSALSKSLKHRYDTTGIYTIRCRAQSGVCNYLFEKEVERISKPKFSIEFDSCLTQNSPFTLKLTDLPDTLVYDISYFADSEELVLNQNEREVSYVFTPICGGNTFLTKVGRLGCADSVLLDGNQLTWCVSDSASSSLYVMPNAFSPNDDDLNDTYGPIWVYDPIQNGFEHAYSFTVYNRWGELIFSTEDPYEYWNGNLGNQAFAPNEQTEEVSEYYVYFIQVNKNCVVGTKPLLGSKRREGTLFITK